MERKFASKLNKQKPAAVARQEAHQQLKETIQSVFNKINNIQSKKVN